ncbi:MAG: T9SS type A sorting domain-containing protein, partial [Candidatus Marinimicrobia bacterium]|nr:T9SS type A sorting domain-containing protein [Candidatus Neomarinimicrobiota bacterium]
SNDVVVAFVEEQCRGVSSPTYSLDQWMYFLIVYSNTTGETIIFKAYDADQDTVLTVTDTLTFISGESHGSPVDPFVFHATDTTMGIYDEMILPGMFQLYQNYPNPFNPVTTLRYDLPEQAFVTLVVYDLLGREVKRLVSGIVVSGYHAVVWDGTNNNGQLVGAGVYLYRIQAGKYAKVSKMVLLR